MRGLMRALRAFLSRAWPYFAIGVAVFIFFYPVWLKKLVPLPADALVAAHVPWTELKWDKYPAGVPFKNLEISDSFSQFYPWRALAGEFWREGKVPLWNSYLFSGTPFLATLHSATLYPLNLFYLVLPDHLAWTFLISSQIFLSLLFMFLFLRELKLSPSASLLGALTFSFSGYMIGWLEFGTGGHAGLWLPLILLFENKYFKTEKFKWILATSLAFFFVFTAGDFQVPVYIVATYLLFSLFNFRLKKNYKALPLLILGLIAGVALSLPQLLPSLELYKQSIRVSGISVQQQYNYGIMGWEKITNFIWPDFYGNVVTGNYWGKYSYHEYISYVSIISLVFVFFSFIKKKTKPEIFFWIILFVALILLLENPISYLPYRLKIPIFSTSSASRILFLTGFSLAALSAFGLDKFQKKNDLRGVLKVSLFFLAITCFVAGVLAINIYFKPLSVNLKVSLRNLVPGGLLTLALFGFFIAARFLKTSNLLLKFSSPFIIFLVIIDVFRFGWKNTPFSPKEFIFPTNRITEFLQEQQMPFRVVGGIPTNLLMPFKIDSAEGYDALYPTTYGQWLSAMEGIDVNIPAGTYGLLHNFDSPLINYTNIKYVVDYLKGPSGEIDKNGEFNPDLDLPRYKKVLSLGRVGVFENQEGIPRSWISSNYLQEEGPEEIIKILKENRQKVLVLQDSLGDIEKSNYYNDTISIKEGRNRLEIVAESDRNSILFLSQSYYPGWKAFLDGQETKIARTNFTFQSVFFPKGRHKVEFIYEPESFKIGKWISASTLFVLLAILINGQYKKIGRRTSRTSSS